MALPVYDFSECDGPTKVEDGLRKGLQIHPWVTVRCGAIEKVFEIVTEEGETLDATCEEKCQCLCKRLNCTCEKNHDSETYRFVLKSQGKSGT